MASQGVQLTDARNATFYDVGGNQYIYESISGQALFNIVCNIVRLLFCQ